MPWRGERYGTDRPRILVLGESHYGKPEWNTSEFTRTVVREWGLGKRNAFMTRVAKLVDLHDPLVYISDTDRAVFWQSVAFYNYVQRFVATTVRVAPSAADWSASAKTVSLCNPGSEARCCRSIGVSTLGRTGSCWCVG